MSCNRFSGVVLYLIFLTGITPELPAQEKSLFTIPETVTAQMLMDHKSLEGKNYLAFPALLRLSDEQVLVTFKRGTSHGSDREADCDALVLNTVTNRVTDHFRLGSIPAKKFQLTVPVKTADGTVRLYTDMQNQGQDNKNYREGMHFSVLEKDGRSAQAWKKLPEIGGIEYGYPFDFIVEGKTVYMLAMSFGYRPGSTWSVAVLRSDDGAATWKFVKDITAALGGGPINESSFVRAGNDFLVVCRGYPGQSTRIARFDSRFNLLKVADLTGSDKALSNYIGWPRIFLRDGQVYVLGRIWPNLTGQPSHSKGMENSRLGLIRIDPATLTIKNVSLLDNADGLLPVKDGYYAAPYWQTVGEETWFNTVTYRSLGTADAPDIIRFAFLWEEVK
ncbi:hypothetical protein GCM10023091_37130 [Ravibacter arvi]|uniref:Exo-alpha-sialidase n=1 Tax=Ravibacter arvi TaxID=2051041 RepID=A0ABP8M6M0_9BACT